MFGLWGKSRAKREAPATAAALGLRFLQAETHGIGEFKGRFGGREITVDMDLPLIRIWLRAPRGCTLSSMRPFGIPADQVPFDFGDRQLDGMFPTRYGLAAIAKRVQVQPDTPKLVKAFRCRWRRPIKFLHVDDGMLDCKLYVLRMYIPARVLTDILPDLIELAAALEPTLNGGKPGTGGARREPRSRQTHAHGHGHSLGPSIE